MTTTALATLDAEINDRGLPIHSTLNGYMTGGLDGEPTIHVDTRNEDRLFVEVIDGRGTLLHFAYVGPRTPKAVVRRIFVAYDKARYGR